MDPNDSDIIFLEEVNSKKCEGIPSPENSGAIQANGDLKIDAASSCNGDDMNEDVPDLDDLEVLDCWEEVEESNEESERNDHSKEEVHEPLSSSGSADVQLQESLVSPSTKRKRCEDLAETTKPKNIVSEKNLDAPKAASNVNSNAKKTDNERASSRTVNDTASNAPVKGPDDTSNPKKVAEKIGLVKNVQTESEKKSSSVPSANVRKSNAAESEKYSRHPREKSKDIQASNKNSNEKNFCPSDPNLSKDATEMRVDRFLKEMARNYSHVASVKEMPHDEKSLEPISSDSSIVSPPGLDPSDLPPGVDMDQVAKDTSTSVLLGAIKQSQTLPSREIPESSRQTSRERADSSKGVNRENEGKGRSPFSKTQDKSSMFRNSGSSPRRESSHESFSLSPSPTPRPRRVSPTSGQHPRVPPNYSIPNVSSGYSERSYPTSSYERNRYHRSPMRENVLHELPRSISRERVRHRSRSRSRSRGRTFVRRRSRSRHQYSSKEEHYRRYRRSSSHSRSPTRRNRSRSRSQSRHHYGNKRSPMWDDDQRSKRPRLSRSISRSCSPWKSHAETPSNEWHLNYSNANRNPILDEEVKLEHDMARFIATNIAATGLRPPVSNLSNWYEAGVQSLDMVSPNSQAIPEPPDIVDRAMPLPPPPPDISELMALEEIKETNSQQEMSTVPTVSLSSLLESAVTGFPEKVIMDRCQDAIMKLRDVSIKPGRFAVMSTIKVPQAEPSSTFQPWQSVLNRSLASKIHFNFSKLSEQPVYWVPKPIPVKTASTSVKDVLPSSSSQSIVSSTVDMDRSALLEKIFLLTRELQEVKRSLDRKSVSKRHKAVQTSIVNYCDNCGNVKKSMIPKERQPQKDSSSSAASGSQSNSSLALESTRLPGLEYGSSWTPVPQPVPPQQSVRPCQPVLTPQPVRLPQTASPQQSGRLPQPVPPPQAIRPPQPVPAPLQVQPGKQVPSPIVNQNSSQPSGSLISKPLASSSLLGTPPTAGPSQTINWCLAKQPGPSSSMSSTVSSGQQSGTNQLATPTTSSIPTLIPPNKTQQVTKKAGKNKTVPPQKAPVTPAPSKGPRTMASSDYDVTKYQMVGDQHLLDLICYFKSVGKKINYDTKFVSHGHTVDTLLNSVIGHWSGKAGCKKSSQIVLFFGLYDANYSQKNLSKFIQLVGYLKKRCSHLVIIEPPPIPKHTSCIPAWNTFSSLEQEYQSFKGDNVSLVKITSFLLLNPGTPNDSLFDNPLRLSANGLKLIAEELERVIAAVRKEKYWLS